MNKLTILTLLCVVSIVMGCNKKSDDKIVLSISTAQAITLEDNFSQRTPNWQPHVGTWAFTSKSLKQTSVKDHYPLILRQDQQFSDLDISVQFRPISGQIDASGGIVFRAIDSKNYYVVRANSLENNFRLYTVKNGIRRQIASTRVTPPQLDKVHSIRVIAKGTHIQAYLNDQLLLDHHDSTFSVGFTGLWTKADAVTEFTNYKVIGVE